jgi:hypothetical protein
MYLVALLVVKIIEQNFLTLSAIVPGLTTASRSILVNLVVQIPPVALYQVFQNRYFGTALSSIASTVKSD